MYYDGTDFAQVPTLKVLNVNSEFISGCFQYDCEIVAPVFV